MAVPITSRSRGNPPRLGHAARHAATLRRFSTDVATRLRATPAVVDLSPESIEALNAELRSSSSSAPSVSGSFVSSPKGKRATTTPKHARRTSPGARPGIKSPLNITRRPPAAKATKQPDPPASTPHTKESWQTQKSSLLAKFGSATWSPRKRLSPDCLSGIRALHAQYSLKYTTPVLAARFEVSPEVIRRILKSKWVPNDDEANDRRKRWERRGEKIWERLVEVGVRAPKKWREMGLGQGANRRKAGGRRVRGRGDTGDWELERRNVERQMEEDETDWSRKGLGERIL